MDDSDRLTTAPRQAMTCSNCGCPMFPPRCASCGWVDELCKAAAAFMASESGADDDADDTDLFDDGASGEQP